MFDGAVEIQPDVVHIPGWLSLTQQNALVAACRDWSQPPAGMRSTRMPNGSMMSVQTVCLGWHWVPYRYVRVTEDGSPVKPFPEWLGELGRKATAESGFGSTYSPDVALVNFYTETAKMGMHADKDEHSAAPVVSLSLGDSCLFRFGNTAGRSKPWTDVLLNSGDLFVFGGPARLAYHAVLKTLPGTGPPDIGVPSGRLNITLRESGLGDSSRGSSEP